MKTSQVSEPLRKDAAENRTKILNAARSVFAEHGTTVPLETIAVEAGVGIATLYRRFPTREDLLATIISEELETYLRALDEALALKDPWESFCFFLERMCQLQAHHPGLCHTPFVTLPGTERLEEARKRMLHLLDDVLGRAKRQGAVRADITTQDLMLVAWGNAGIIANSTNGRADALKRYLELMLDAFRVNPK